jgi:hypothetical protein
MARAIILFLAKRLGLARVSKFETPPATRQKRRRRDECWVESKTRRVMIRLFWFFLREKEKIRVVAKDSRAEARHESF